MNELQAFEKHLRENEKSPAKIENTGATPVPSCSMSNTGRKITFSVSKQFR